ncbi:MAG: HEAT repeat domain-containing protein [Candidatus Firestonebacteria bacterium]
MKIKAFCCLFIICSLSLAEEILQVQEDVYKEEAKWHYNMALEVLSKKENIADNRKEAIRVLHEIIDCYDSTYLEGYALLIKLYKEEKDEKNLKAIEDRYKARVEIEKKFKEEEAKEVYSSNKNINETIIKLGSNDFKTRVKAGNELLKLDKEAVDGLIKSLNSKNIYRACLSANILGKLKDKKAIIPLGEVLKSGFPSLKISAIESLGNIKDESSISYLINTLSDSFYSHYEGEYKVREKASEVLIKVYKNKALPYLLKAVKNPSLRWYTLETLIKFKPLPKGLEDILNEALADGDEKIRLTAIKGVSNVQDKNKFFSSFVKLIADKNATIRHEVVKLLAEIPKKESLDLLILALSDSDKDVVNESIKALGKFKLDDVKELLVKLAEDEKMDVSIRWNAIKSLGENFKKYDILELKKLLEDENIWIKSAAAAALDFEKINYEDITSSILKKRRENLDALALRFSLSSANVFEEGRQASIRKGLNFLVKEQAEDGHFKSKYFPLGVTQLALLCLLKEGWSEEDTVVKKGLKYMLEHEQKDGSYISKSEVALGNNIEKQRSSYTSAIAIMVLAATKNQKYTENIKRSIEFLKSIQDKEGGFGYFKDTRSDMSCTEFAMLGLDSGYDFLKLDKKDELWMKLTNYLKKQQNPDGGFGYTKEWEKASYGSMTSAGLTCQMLAHMDLTSSDVKNTLSWVSKNYTLDSNPKADSDKHHPDYLKSLAMGLHLTGLNSVIDDKGNMHYWYKELIEKLIKEQKSEGFWEAKYYEPVLCTEFYIMILQLKKLEEEVMDIF